MKLWLVTQEANDGYDTYDGMVVAAKTEDVARRMHPNGYAYNDREDGWVYHGKVERAYGSWAYILSDVTAKCIGDAAPGIKAGVILASFNAG
jgi:hypothetical protein